MLELRKRKKKKSWKEKGKRKNGNKSRYKVLRDSKKGKRRLYTYFHKKEEGIVNCVSKTYATVNNNSEVVIYCRLQ